MINVVFANTIVSDSYVSRFLFFLPLHLDCKLKLKNNHAKSRLHPEAGEKNVKCFFGLALDKEKLTGAITSDPETSTTNRQNELEASTLYYENMIHTFQELQTKIRSELETLAQITLQANHGHIPLI